MRTDFHRIAIVNRAEPALRFIRAVREFNREHGTAIETVALFAAPDRSALFVREADRAVDLGDGPIVEDRYGRRRVVYLDLDRVERGIIEADADAVWAGWGFLAERPDFVERCEALGLAFIGPPARAMRIAGEKVSAKELARHLGIPVIPWGSGVADTVEKATSDARSLGFPVALKAASGAGGRAIQRVESEAQLAPAFERVRDEARRLFESDALLVERWIVGARQVEVQLAADVHGTAWAIGTRDCTVQRRHQKVIEEAPAAGLTPAQDAALREDALKFCRSAGYQNVGSVEFLLDSETGRHYFLEMNARQQVEHAVTEMTSGLDLVKLQIHLARGGRLEGAPPPASGHAIEVRLNAEDPASGFAPSSGVVSRLRVSPREGLRLDAGIGEGDIVPPEYDSMFAKLIAHRRTRGEAIDTLIAALNEASVVIDGGVSNRAFLLTVLEQPQLRGDHTSVDWLDTLAAEGRHISGKHADVALVQAAIEACDATFEAERDEFLATAARQRPVLRTEVGRTFDLRYRGHTYVAQVHRQSPLHYRVMIDGVRVDSILDRIGPAERLITVAGRRYRTQSLIQGLTHLVEIDDSMHRISRDEAGIVRALSPSVVVRVHVKPGDRVDTGDPLLVVESMKMETPMRAAGPGTVRDVWVLPNAQVGAGTALLRLDHDTPVPRDAAASPRVEFTGHPPSTPSAPADSWRSRARAVVAGLRAFAEGLAPPHIEHVRNILAELRELMLGSDVPAADVRRLLDEYRGLGDRVPPDDPVILRLEDAMLRVYADVSALFGRQGVTDDPDEPTRLSAEQYFLTYVRTLEARGAGLPSSFVARLRRALAHFGSDSLEVTTALKNRVFWLSRSHLRAGEQALVVQAILERRARYAPHLVAAAPADFPDLLEQIASSSPESSHVSDLARDVHYRYYVQPSFERGRQLVYDEIEEHLGALKREPNAPDREARIKALVECPQPLGHYLSGRFEDADPVLRDLMLEVLTRRYYRIRVLNWLRFERLDTRSVLSAEYELEGTTYRLVVTHAQEPELAAVLASLRQVFATVPADRELLLDLYVSGAKDLESADATSQRLARALNTALPGQRALRAFVAVGGASPEWAGSATPQFTFRSAEGRLDEDRVYRGIHPMVGARLEISRLRNFQITRLPSAEDVYVFHAMAQSNAKDQRLFAFAEVRDLTVVRDERGNVLEMPQVERSIMESVMAMREFQLRRSPEERLIWNRIVLSLVQPFTFTKRELVDMGRRMAPHLQGIELDKMTLVGPMLDPVTGTVRRLVVNISNPAGRGLRIQYIEPHDRPIPPLTEYETKVVRMRQRGLTYPYEVVRLLTPEPGTSDVDLPPGEFIEHDLDANGALAPVSRSYGQNTANMVVGVIRSFTPKYRDGLTRVILIGDPSREMGSLAEPECRRISEALKLAASMRVPLEWFALSAGAKISMQSGTENMDWIAKVLRDIVEFTQGGGEINIIVTGINVGAQPYWNAEATMLMHTRGILVMMPESAMVLTGKMALDYSGAVSAEDNIGIGGYERIMGPNGQAQYWAPDLNKACQILMAHYDHCYVKPGERFPRRAETSDPITRDVCTYPHGRVETADFVLVGDAFSSETNPGRKKPFDIRRIMHAVRDQDHEPIERWTGMLDAEVSVVWDAHVGGYPVCLLGFESRRLPRLGFVPTDGPDHWTSGTLFPMSSKKTARAINAASDNRPLVVLANLSGFDGSPESMRRRQLEFGAEIGRAVVNFKGPIVFCVVSRYHGGAFVVFSKDLNDNMEVTALEGTYASVIGGAPAAAVVFAREVDQRTRKEPRVAELDKEIAATTDEAGKRRLRSRLAGLQRTVRSEKLGEVADEFDHIHSVHRALKVGSLDRIIPPTDLRPYIVDALERLMKRELERWEKTVRAPQLA